LAASPRRLGNDYVAALPAAPRKDGKPTYVLHPDIGRGNVENLRLRVTSGGTKAWVLSARFPSNPRNPTLRRIGPWPDIKLDEARDVAVRWNALIRKKIDPQDQAEAEVRAERDKRETAAREEARKRTGTFANVAEAYIAKRVAKMRSSRDVANLIRRALVKRWGGTPVTEISKTDVIDMLEDIEGASGTYAAHQAFSHGRTLFTWLLEREDPKRPTLGITANPFIGVRPDKFISERKPRQRVLTDREIRLIWKATEGESTAVYPTGQFVRLLLILGVRRNELARATWPEFDLQKATWQLADTRVKNEETRVIPLPQMALDILNALPRFTGGPYLLTASGGRAPWTSYDFSKKAVDRKVADLNGGQPINNWRFHDLRRSMRTGLSAIPTISPIVAELMIGHRQQGLAKIYDLHAYGAEQRAGFEAWCARLRTIVEPQPDNVVALPVRA
jgi:integrase